MSKIRLSACRRRGKIRSEAEDFSSPPEGAKCISKPPSRRSDLLKITTAVPARDCPSPFLPSALPAFTQMKIQGGPDQRMLYAVCKSIAVKQICLLPRREFVQRVIQFPICLLFRDDLFRRFGKRVGNRPGALHPFFVR